MMKRVTWFVSGVAAGAVGALIGAFGGALIGETVSPGPGGLIGLAGGAALFGVGEGVTDWMRRPGQPKPHVWRIFGAVFFAAACACFSSF